MTQSEKQTTSKRDYLAIAYIMAGSVFGRSSSRVRAIERCRQEARDFARPFGGFKTDAVLTINVFDVTGHDRVTWDDWGVNGDGPNPIPFPDHVKINPHLKYVG